MKHKIIAIADDENRNLMVLDSENEAIPNKPTIFDYVDSCSFSNQNVGVALYVNKETNVGIVRVFTCRGALENQYVYLYDSQGELSLDIGHYYNIVEWLDQIIEQAEPNEISITECAEFIFHLDGVHEEEGEDAEDFFDEHGNWSLEVMRENIIANKQFHTVMNEYIDHLNSLSGQEAYDEAHKQAHDAGEKSADWTREFLKNQGNDEQKKNIESLAKTAYDRDYAKTYDSVISDTQEAHTNRPVEEAA